ncbi:hypothetical protein Pelo_10585 [Pelomyxa schiedti]|nr:hypothetical protein Pelo_10585 [Pelomyxa schiedti]
MSFSGVCYGHAKKLRWKHRHVSSLFVAAPQSPQRSTSAAATLVLRSPRQDSRLAYGTPPKKRRRESVYHLRGQPTFVPSNKRTIVGSILSWLSRHPRRAKPDPSIPQRLTSRFHSFVGRKKTVRAYMKFLQKTVLRNRNKDKKTKTEKWALCATCGAPGSGKSRLLDYIARVKWAKYKDTGKNFTAALTTAKSWVPVLITFNSWSEWDIEESNNPGQALAGRILSSYFVNCDYHQKFIKWVGINLLKVSALDAVESILYHSKKSCIFLGVDEIANSKSSLLNLCYECTASGRTIHWIPLPSLQLSDSQSLFRDLDPRLMENVSVKCAISGCGGHPRTLETLHSILKEILDEALEESSDPEYQSDSSTDTDPPLGLSAGPMSQVDSRILNYDPISLKLERQLCKRFSASQLSLPVLKPVLLGERCPLEMKIGDKTVHDLIRSGVYCNGLDVEGINQEEVIPCVPLIRIYLWAVKITKRNGRRIYPPKERIIANLIKNKLISGFSWLPGSRAGTLFEDFHFSWEVITGLLCASEDIDLIDHYKGAVFPSIPEDQVLELCYPGACKAQLLDHHFNLEHLDLLFDSVVLPAACNPGFDIARGFFTKEGHTLLPTVIEMKFSEEGSATKFTAPEIRKKHKLIKNTFPENTQLAIMFISRQELPSPLPEFTGTDIVGFIGKDQLKELYGPTLASAPQFNYPLESLLAQPPTLRSTVTSASQSISPAHEPPSGTPPNVNATTASTLASSRKAPCTTKRIKAPTKSLRETSTTKHNQTP